MPAATPPRPRSALLTILLLWIAFYASFTLFFPALLDDADSVHAEVAREMLLRHDYITLYANGIRYLEKAPLLYWSMAASMRISQLTGATSPRALAVAARIPLSLTILALALLAEAFARRLVSTTQDPAFAQRAGLYAALILLSSPGIFLFSRILLPDAMVCLFTTAALYFFWRTEEPSTDPQPSVHSTAATTNPVFSTEAQRSGANPVFTLRPATKLRLNTYAFAAACALNVLSKGLIGLVFPLAIAILYLLITRGLTGTLTRLRQLHPLTSTLLFFAIAAPWHLLAGLANPTQGTPAPFQFIHHHWLVPLPTDGNVHGWFWFYFMNEHLLRYLNLRVPHDYDTSPLWLFYGLIFIWLMPFSAFSFQAIGTPLRQWFASIYAFRHTPTKIFSRHNTAITRPQLFLLLWAAVPLLFFSLSTRQEYYVLPSLPPLALLIAHWLSASRVGLFDVRLPALTSWRINLRINLVLLVAGTLFAVATTFFLLHTRAPSPNADLAALLAQNPGDYALSMGHFLDLNTHALGLFRLPLALAALGLFGGPLAAYMLRRQYREHAANLSLAAGAFTFLLAAHLGLQTFAPVLSSAQLVQAIAPQVHPQDLIEIHGEYESGSTLAFYLQRNDIHILDGRSSNLWYGSFFPDAPKIFETRATLAAKWASPQRIFLWQSITDPPNQLPTLPTPVYILVKSGGKEILSNQPNR